MKCNICRSPISYYKSESDPQGSLYEYYFCEKGREHSYIIYNLVGNSVVLYRIYFGIGSSPSKIFYRLSSTTNETTVDKMDHLIWNNIVTVKLPTPLVVGSDDVIDMEPTLDRLLKLKAFV